jgi:hypothetical protein
MRLDQRAGELADILEDADLLERVEQEQAEE